MAHNIIHRSSTGSIVRVIFICCIVSHGLACAHQSIPMGLQMQQTNQPQTLAERAERQRATYWRVRIQKTIERLEYEARRMLALEAELGAFAEEYYETVGEAVNRLTALEQQLVEPVHLSGAPAMPEIEQQREAREARKVELKTRYRQLAREIHPDRTMLIDAAGMGADRMQLLNAAYERGDLAGLLRIEAQMLLTKLSTSEEIDDHALESAITDVVRATETYANAYRSLLHSPLNELMLRSMSAQVEGWDWMQAVVRRVERTIEEKEQILLAMQQLTPANHWQNPAQAA
jgi:hypothetical protein